MPQTEEEQKQLGVEFLGFCPHCRSNDGYLNIGKTHVVFCDEHKVCWVRGGNLFGSWRHETEEDWDRNAKKLAEYREVEPYFPPSLSSHAFEDWVDSVDWDNLDLDGALSSG